MTRARTPIVAASLLVVALAAPSVRAQDPPLPDPSLSGAPPAAAPAPAEAERGPIRSFFHRVFTQGKKTPRSGHSDWTTGGDSKLSKPWLR